VEITISPYKDPAAGLDWHEQTPLIIDAIRDRIRIFPGGQIEVEFLEENYGTAADWPVIKIKVLAVAGVLLFGVPEAHKYIRETYEEWQHMAREVDSVVTTIAGSSAVLECSVGILIFDALKEIHKTTNAADLRFLNVKKIPGERGFGTVDMPDYLFTFCSDTKIYQVAVHCDRSIVWVNELEIKNGT
jgi:hypothetical protein